MNLDAIYEVLAEEARQGKTAGHRGQMYYSDLSDRYYKKTGDWHEPHGSWDDPLGELNRILHCVGWPALSAVVVLGSGDHKGEPGGGFWESSPNVPARPSNDIDRVTLYSRILRDVLDRPWPETTPLAPPPPRPAKAATAKGKKR